MKVTEAASAGESKTIIDGVLSRHEPAEIHRPGRPVAQIRRKAGIRAAELIERLKQVRFTPAGAGGIKMHDGCRQQGLCRCRPPLTPVC